MSVAMSAVDGFGIAAIEGRVEKVARGIGSDGWRIATRRLRTGCGTEDE